MEDGSPHPQQQPVQMVQIIADKSFIDLMNKELGRLHEHLSKNPADQFVQGQIREIHTTLINYLKVNPTIQS